jgi:hypothetical protein
MRLTRLPYSLQLTLVIRRFFRSGPPGGVQRYSNSRGKKGSRRKAFSGVEKLERTRGALRSRAHVSEYSIQYPIILSAGLFGLFFFFDSAFDAMTRCAKRQPPHDPCADYCRNWSPRHFFLLSDMD